MPVRWTAPEALEERKYSSKSDCWSFGVVVLEIWTRAETPYADMSNQKVWTAVLGGYRIGKPHDCPDVVHAVMLECWQAEPDARPSFSELASRFRELEAAVAQSKAASDIQYDMTLLDNLRPVEEHLYVDFTSGTEQVPPSFDRESDRLFVSVDYRRISSMFAKEHSYRIERAYDLAQQEEPTAQQGCTLADMVVLGEAEPEHTLSTSVLAGKGSRGTILMDSETCRLVGVQSMDV